MFAVRLVCCCTVIVVNIIVVVIIIIVVGVVCICRCSKDEFYTYAIL